MSDEISIHEKVWGEEQWIVNNRLYCGKLLKVKPGFRSSVHWHKIKDETFYLTEGCVLLEIFEKDGPQEIFLLEGQKYHLPPGTKHRFTGIKLSTIIEFSTQHLEEDSYRDTQSGVVPPEEFEGILEKAKELGISL